MYLHGSAEALGVIEYFGVQEGHNGVLKVPTQLRLELLDQVLWQEGGGEVRWGGEVGR